MSDEQQQVFKSREARKFLNVSAQTLNRLVRSGQIPVLRIDRDLRFRREALEEWLRSQEGPWEKKGAGK